MPSPTDTGPRRRARGLALAGALGVSALAGACGGSSDGNSAAPSTSAGANGPKTLTIENFAFSPEPLRVPVGTVVKVTNVDDAPHTATADDGAFDTGNLAQGESASITLSEAGQFAFHCAVHDYMQGVIQVTP